MKWLKRVSVGLLLLVVIAGAALWIYARMTLPQVDGSVTGCRAIRSSGHPPIDTAACRLIERRFRYRPALNRAGRPVRSVVEENHTWVLDEDAMRGR